MNVVRSVSLNSSLRQLFARWPRETQRPGGARREISRCYLPGRSGSRQGRSEHARSPWLSSLHRSPFSSETSHWVPQGVFNSTFLQNCPSLIRMNGIGLLMLTPGYHFNKWKKNPASHGTKVACEAMCVGFAPCGSSRRLVHKGFSKTD